MAFSRLLHSRLPVLGKALGQKSRGQGHEQFLFTKAIGEPQGRLAGFGVGWPKHLPQPLWPSQLLEMEMQRVFHFPVKFTRLSIYSISCAETQHYV